MDPIRPVAVYPKKPPGDAETWLAGRINYERGAAMPAGGKGLKLERMRRLVARLGNPERKLRVVHVAGTKGKGSTAAMIAAVLSAAGYKTGLFTSPHLESVHQRLMIDTRPVSDDDLERLLARVRPEVEAMDAAADVIGGPTYFEITTAMAMLYFAGQKADVAVLEVGLGGRLDSTNVCLPAVSVITSISFDHVEQLGHTLAAIAWEKAGIIKPGVPVVSGAEPVEARDVIRRVAEERGCRLVERSRDFDVDYQPPVALDQGEAMGRFDFNHHMDEQANQVKDIPLRLIGRRQAENAGVALAAIEELRRTGWDIPETSVRAGFAAATLPARAEIVGRRPTVLIDGAHNVASITSLVELLEECFSPNRRTLVFATTRDKDIAGMLRVLASRFDKYVLTRFHSNPRGASLETLAAAAAAAGIDETIVIDDPDAAWKAARDDASVDDLIVITGSFFLAAEMRSLIVTEMKERNR